MRNARVDRRSQIEDRRSQIEDRGSQIEDRGSQIEDQGDGAGRLGGGLLGAVLFGAVLFGAVLFAAVAAARGGPPGAGHGFHVPMPDRELYVECRIGSGDDVRSVEHVLKLASTMAPVELDERIELPGPLAPVLIKQYLPQAARRQDVVADEGGAPAINLAIIGRKQQTERWLVSGDAERGSLTSLVGTWRYQVAADAGERDALRRQFEEERSRPARLLVTCAGGDAIEEMPAVEGASQSLEKLNCRVSVLRFYPHFGMDAKTNEPVNQSEARLNPAALVKIERDGEAEEMWVFGRFPDFAAHGGGGGGGEIRVRLDCPIESQNPAPDFVIVTVGGERHEVWTRHEGQVHAAALKLDEPVRIPGANYSFTVKRFVPAGRLVETYEPTTEKRGAVTAVRVDVVTTPGKTTPVWVELGKMRVVPTDVGPVTVTFGLRASKVEGGP